MPASWRWSWRGLAAARSLIPNERLGGQSTGGYDVLVNDDEATSVWQDLGDAIASTFGFPGRAPRLSCEHRRRDRSAGMRSQRTGSSSQTPRRQPDELTSGTRRPARRVRRSGHPAVVDAPSTQGF